MTTTKGALYQDLSHQGGFVFFGATDLAGGFSAGTLSANPVLTRNAAGDYSFNRTAGGAETYQFVLQLDDLKRLIEVPTAPMPFQEFAGTAALQPGYPAPAAGIPPFSGINQLVSPTGMPPKGLRIRDVVAIYNVGVANLTAASLSLNRAVFTNNVARVVTNLPISGVALPLAFQAGDYTVVRTVNSPVFENTDLSDITLELAVTMANTGTIRVYGLGFHVDFNYN